MYVYLPLVPKPFQDSLHDFLEASLAQGSSKTSLKTSFNVSRHGLNRVVRKVCVRGFYIGSFKGFLGICVVL